MLQKIVVVVPTYNNPKTIKAVTKDLQEHNYEVIIVDDGSDENIEAMFEANEKKTFILSLIRQIQVKVQPSQVV